MSQLFVRLRKELTKLEIPDERICNIIDGLSKENLLKKYNKGLFRSDTTRKTYFKKKISCVAPIQVHLDFDASGQEQFCQYVPVKDTLKALLNLPSMREYNVSKMHQPEDPNVLEDVRDDKTFKENTLPQELPSLISVILYQDAFEVVNPLVSGKKNQKLLAVYMTLGDILPHNRSSTDHMQLVMLCRESDCHFFGQDKVFPSLVKDLKDTEQWYYVGDR